MAPAHPLLRLAPRDDGGHVNVVVETPRGSVHKISLDAERGVFVLKKVLPLGLAFPFEFGFVPGTRAGDGDPLDVLLLLDGPLPPGVVVQTRLVGAIELETTSDDGAPQRNDRLVGVGVLSRTFARVHDVEQLPPELLDDVQRFLVAYPTALGTHVTLLGRADAARASGLLDEAIARAER